MPHGYTLSRQVLFLALALSFLAATALAGGPTVYVDADTGSDLNNGTQGTPFKTITHAIGFAGVGGTIYVNPGVYDAALGETFPITLNGFQRLEGDVANRGEGTTPTVIGGMGAYASPNTVGQQTSVVAANGCTITGFRIAPPSYLVGHAGVVIHDVSAVVTENTFTDTNYAGVFVRTASSPTVSNNRFDCHSYCVYLASCTGTPQVTGNIFGDTSLQMDLRDASPYIGGNEFLAGSNVGIQILNGSPEIEGNTFRADSGALYGGIRVAHPNALPIARSNIFENPLGVRIADGSIDLGLLSDPGLNDFTAVTGVSVQHDGTSDVKAFGNSWPNQPPIYGVDIVLNSTGTVNTEIVPTEQLSLGRLKARY